MRNQAINQKAFTKIVTHLRKQGEKSIDDTETCAYRGHNGLKCAIGCLIDDEHYDESLESKLSNHSYVQAALYDSGWGDLDEYMLGELQSTHDLRPIECWESQFSGIAKQFNLVLVKP